MKELKFLLVIGIHEDAEIIQRQLRKEFRFSSLVVDKEKDYIEALKNFKPDIIFSDYFLSKFDGMKALLIRNELSALTPFIIVTDNINDEIVVNCLKNCATDYLNKEHLAMLNFTITKALEQKTLAAEKELAMKELQDSMEQFRVFVENDISGDYLEDEDEVLYCNKRLLEIFEFDSLTELNAYGPINLYEDVRVREKVLNLLKSGKKVESQELRMHTRTGKPLILLENAYIYLDKNGKMLKIQGYLIDITKQKYAEESLRKSGNLFRSLMENTTAGVIIYNKEFFLYVNPAITQLLGYSEEELLKMHYWDVIHPDHRHLVEERGKRRIDQKEVPPQYQFKVLTKTGNTKWVEYTAGPLLMYKDSLAAIGTIYDITGQKKAAMEIKKLSTVIEQSPFIVEITGTDGNIEYVNKAFTEISGYQKHEVLGRNLRILQSGKTPKKTFDELWKTIASGKVWKGEFINTKKNGDLYIEWAVISPILDENGNVVRYAGIKRDISMEKRLEQELLQERRKVEEANRLKTAILTNMSHELRTPLNSILGFSTLMLDSNNLEEMHEMTQYINDSGQRLLRTLNLVIDVSRLEAGNFEPDFQEVDIYALIQKLFKDFNEEATKKNLKIIFDAPMTAFPVVCDLKFIHGILENLLDNAIKFTNKGSITLSIRTEKNGKMNYAVIDIVDTGIGISEKSQKIIFEDFQQESVGYGRVYEGTGLGLSLARKYVELLGGYINLKSKVGEGSTFSIFIPVNQKKT